MELFKPPHARKADHTSPLAARMRPRGLDEFLGQKHVLGQGSLLRSSIEKGELCSLILWGPPGSGKTTLAHIIAHGTPHNFVPFGAVTSGIKEIKKVMQEAAHQRKLANRKTVLIEQLIVEA